MNVIASPVASPTVRSPLTANVLDSVAAPVTASGRPSKSQQRSLPSCAQRRVRVMYSEAWSEGATRSAAFLNSYGTGEPLVVRGVQQRLALDWSPAAFCREHGDMTVAVLNVVSDMQVPGSHSLADFFGSFSRPSQQPVAGGGDACATAPPRPQPTLKLRDWPPLASSRAVLPAAHDE